MPKYILLGLLAISSVWLLMPRDERPEGDIKADTREPTGSFLTGIDAPSLVVQNHTRTPLPMSRSGSVEAISKTRVVEPASFSPLEDPAYSIVTSEETGIDEETLKAEVVADLQQAGVSPQEIDEVIAAILPELMGGGETIGLTDTGAMADEVDVSEEDTAAGIAADLQAGGLTADEIDAILTALLPDSNAEAEPMDEHGLVTDIYQSEMSQEEIDEVMTAVVPDLTQD